MALERTSVSMQPKQGPQYHRTKHEVRPRDSVHAPDFCFLTLAFAVLAFDAAFEALIAIFFRSAPVRALARAWPPFWPISRIASRNASRSMRHILHHTRQGDERLLKIVLTP